MPRLAVIGALIPALIGAGLPASRSPVLVLTESGVDAYTEAVDGVASALPAGSFRVVDTASRTLDRDLAASEPEVVIAVGSRALEEARARHLGSRVVAALSLPEVNSAPGVWRISLEIPLAAQLAIMHTLWPGKMRAGVIRGPRQSRASVEAMEACARKEGYALTSTLCEGPAQLLRAFASLRGKADFVICFPDADIYNAATIKPLVLASLEQRLPLVGFSPAFVRAGAAAGFFPDYRESGRQAAEVALRLLRGAGDAEDDESPRKIRTAVNQRVTRLLGVEFRAAALAAEVYR